MLSAITVDEGDCTRVPSIGETREFGVILLKNRIERRSEIHCRAGDFGTKSVILRPLGGKSSGSDECIHR